MPPPAFAWQIVTVLAFTLPNAFAPVSADLPWHDHRFMQMLSDTNLDNLGRIHAIQQRDQATNSDTKAHWQQILAKMARTQMWFANHQDRAEILQHNLKDSLAIQNIQDPLLRFRLSIETGRMIQAESKAALVTAEATNLYGKQPSLKPVVSKKRLQQLSTEIKRLEAIQQQIGRRNSIFSGRQKTRVQTELRLLIASLKCQQFHWQAINGTTKFTQPLNNLNAELEALARSARTIESKTHLRILLADLAARYSSKPDYTLRMTPLLSEGIEIDSSALGEIQIRYQLKYREVQTAERYLASLPTVTHLEKQRQMWLAAEVCVGQVEQAARLNDSAMISSAQICLNKLQIALAESKTGAYADAARQCLQKSQRILELGPELATLLEQVDASRRSSDNEKALQQIGVALKRLPARQAHAARPALLLIATQLNIDQQLWEDAIVSGSTAAHEFQQHGLPEKAAAADLLKCFAMAQTIRKNPSQRPEYLTALQTHSQIYPQSSTSAVTVQWLLQLTMATQPDIAIHAASERIKQTEDAAERSRLLTTVRQIFWQLLTSKDTKFETRLSIWQNQLRQSAPTEIDLRSADGNLGAIAIQLGLSPVSTKQISAWHQQFVKQTVRQPSIQKELQYQLLNFILNAKLSVATRTSQQQQQKLLEQPTAKQQQAFFYLSRVLNVSRRQNKILPGDILIARTLDQLAINLLQSSQQPASEALSFLPTISATASMTGDQQATQQIMATLSTNQISTKDLQLLVPSLIQLSIQSEKQQTTITPEFRRALIQFWRRLIEEQPAGSDLWLEGLLQVGTLTAVPQDIKELKRQFQMANVLYPEWGSAERKVRATAVLKRLQNAP